ncbi:alpha-hydroxy acid oxidase [soil metagenome]
MPNSSSSATDVSLEFSTLDEIRQTALASLDDSIRGYLEGGASAEETLQRNRSVFDKWALRPRSMSGLPAPSSATSFLGVPLELPVLTAPFGSDALFHPDGQVAVARANKRSGTASIVPEAGSHPIEDVRRAGGEAAAFGQLHPMGPEENFVRMLRRYEAAGYRGICVTCDCPTAGWRERDRTNRFTPTAAVIGGNYPNGSEVAFEEVFGQIFSHAEPVWGWHKLGELMKTTTLPWMAKGILTAEDAVAAVEAGASALLVSNHGGRQLDGVVASLDALPPIRRAVGTEIEIAVDSGIRRGTDIVKALALGADVVVLGRLAVYALAAGGEEAVYRTLELLRDEITTILTLLGRGSAHEITESAVQWVES